MKRLLVLVTTVLFAAWLTSGCAPQRPEPGTAAPRPQPAASISAQQSSQSPAESAWQKVEQAARKEGTVTIYAHFFTGDSGRAMASAFRERYGIKVEVLVVNSRTAVEKIKVEQKIGQPIADMINLGHSSAVELTMTGLGISVADELPVLKDREAFLIDPIVDPNKQILKTVPSFVSPIINTNHVKPQDEPQSYYDFLDPKWKGKIILTDPRTGAGTGFEWFNTSRYYKALDDSFFRRLMEQKPFLWGGGDTEAYRMLARGEYALTPAGGGNSVASLVVEGAPLKALSMKEGSNASGETIVVIKDSPHPNATKLFANWLLSEDGQTVYAKASYKKVLRKGVPDFSPQAIRVEPKKILNRNWELLSQSREQFELGLIEEIFGKK